MSIREMMAVPPTDRDPQWLLDSLQHAIELEWSTIPPYLCAYWSIRTGPTVPASTREIAGTILSVVIEEMLHMGLACNMLAGIGGTPGIYSANSAPQYPGPLPGDVHPGLTVSLAGLARDTPGNTDQLSTFMQIELPEDGPLAVARAAGFPTIGEFYDALATAFEQVNPTLQPGRQLTTAFLPELTVLNSVADVKAAIDLIKRQGEGTSSSPFASDGSGRIAAAPELAHYYRFGEIHAGRRLVADATAPHGWSFTGAPLPFPAEADLYLMAEVPRGGYSPESDAFDRAYTSMLKTLHDAWAQGDSSMLDDAINSMDTVLTPAATAILDAGISTGSGRGIKGPDFRFLA